jgi:mannitol-specific phosphotransferase system IIBC component
MLSGDSYTLISLAVSMRCTFGLLWAKKKKKGKKRKEKKKREEKRREEKRREEKRREEKRREEKRREENPKIFQLCDAGLFLVINLSTPTYQCQPSQQSKDFTLEVLFSY